MRRRRQLLVIQRSKQKRGSKDKRTLRNTTCTSHWKLVAYSLIILVPLWDLSNMSLKGYKSNPLDIYISVGNNTNVTSSVITRDAVKSTMPLNGSSGNNNNSGIVPIISAFKKDIIVQQNFLDCDDIKKLEIVRQISSGINKVVFEVKLPGSNSGSGVGVSAIAKRTFQLGPYKQGLIKKETKFLKELQEEYGTEETLGYFGECDASSSLSDESFTERFKKGKGNISDIMRDFSVGYTSIVEMGTPLLLNDQLIGPSSSHICTIASRKCFANFFTESDIEDLKNIARQYANFSKYPMTLRKRHFSDNCKAEQYVATTTGSLRHADLDMVYERRDLTYSEALEINCSVIRLLLNNETLNCSSSSTTTTANNNPIDDEAREERNHRRINVTAAVNYCSALP